MRLDFLQPLLTVPGPFATAYVDVSRNDENAAHEIELRWRGLREQLAEQGAPAATIDAVEPVVLEPTGVSGRHGLVVVAADGRVVFERVLPHPPQPDGAVYEPLPHLLPLVRQHAWLVPYVLVVADRHGADISVVGPLGDAEVSETVKAEDRPLRKVPVGGWSQRRFQQRAENTWERAAEDVAATVRRVVAEHQPRLVALAGEERFVSELRRELAEGKEGELVEVLDAGGRAAGTDDHALQDALVRATRVRAVEDAGAVLREFEQERGRHAAAATGLEDTLEALRKAQVEALLLRDDPKAEPEYVWAGTDPFQVGVTEDEVRALGAERVERVRADAALLRAAAATDASVILLPMGGPRLGDWVGALLRYSDASTPSA